jgi:hypothetical protein
MMSLASAAAEITAADILRYLDEGAHNDLHLGWLSRAYQAAGNPPPAAFVAMVAEQLASAVDTLPQGKVLELYRGLQNKLQDADCGHHWTESFDVAHRYGPHTYATLALSCEVNLVATLARRISWPEEREISLSPAAAVRPAPCHGPLPSLLADSELVDENGLVVAYHSGQDHLRAGQIRPNLHLGTLRQAKMRGGRCLTKVVARPAPAVRLRDRGEQAWCKRRLRAHVRKGKGYCLYLNRHEGIDLDQYLTARSASRAVDTLPDRAFRRTIPSAQDSLILLDPELILALEPVK